MILFDKHTGKPVCILLDEGYLTDIRTAAAGYVVAKYLAPKNVACVGIVGTGAQAYYQLKFFSLATQCRRAMIWGRDIEKAKKLAKHPLLLAEHVKPGTHITAVGADDIGKQELDEKVFIKVAKVIVDSRSQCAAFSDVSYALKKGLIGLEKLVELGEVLTNPSLGRTSDNQITVCDLTGIAIQDLQIAESVFSDHC